MVKDLPAVQGTQVWSLGQEDPLEKRMATHSSILAWRIPWTEEPGGLQSMRSQRVSMTEKLARTRYTWVLKCTFSGFASFILSCIESLKYNFYKVRKIISDIYS